MDSPDFTTVKKEKAVVKAPVLRARLRHQKVGFTKDELLGDTMVAAALGMISVPFFGFLSDLIGRRLMYGIGIVSTAIFAFPYFGLLNTKVAGMALLAIVISLLVHDMQYGPQAALIAENFGTNVRYSGGPGLPARIGDRRWTSAADRHMDPQEHGLEYRHQLVHRRVLRRVHDRADPDAKARTTRSGRPVDRASDEGAQPRLTGVPRGHPLGGRPRTNRRLSTTGELRALLRSQAHGLTLVPGPPGLLWTPRPNPFRACPSSIAQQTFVRHQSLLWAK